MNALVLILASVVGVGIGVVIWWFQRSLVWSALAAASVIGLVALALPPSVPPIHDAVAPPRRPSAPSAARQRPTLAMLQSVRPVEVPADGYVASDACRECHPNNHASWHASYHRTMTQVATPEAVLGDFDDVQLRTQGRDYHLRRHHDVCWVEMPDPALPVASRVDVPIVMTTGSHHMQVYWYATGVARTVGVLPIVFLKETQEWIPRSAAFLKPDNVHNVGDVGRWNATCSKCHTTHRRERPRTYGHFDTYAAEFGISCEACHGPGQQHIEYHRAAAANRDRSTVNPNRDIADPIVNPLDLSAVKSSQVCGQCHSVMSLTEDQQKLREQGHGFRPGKDLNETHLIWRADSQEMRDFLSKKTLGVSDEAALSRTYYRDGMVRVSGREYNGLILSPCHQAGEMSCLSCHQLHKPDSDPRSLEQWADDQLQPLAMGKDACLQCHPAAKYASNHTHHQPDSVGSNCYNCHMPHTAYGLLKAIRNHTISSPNVADDLHARRPGACNLCHLDQTLGWAAEHLESWYGIDPPELAEDQRRIAASLLWILKGDAAERALVAWSMGWPDALETSGSDWQTPFIAQLLNDPYPAIRIIARRTLEALEGPSRSRFDPMTSETKRENYIQQIRQQWKQRYTSGDQDRPQLLIEQNELRMDVLLELLSQRDDTHTDLAE